MAAMHPGERYVYLSAVLAADVPPAVLTCTSTGPPSGTAGDVTVICEAVAAVTVAAIAPKVTELLEATGLKLLPVIVTVVAPAFVPEVGDMAVTTGTEL